MTPGLIASIKSMIGRAVAILESWKLLILESGLPDSTSLSLTHLMISCSTLALDDD